MLAVGQLVGHASAFNVSEAVRAVITTCVIRRRIGGIATSIGMASVPPWLWLIRSTPWT